MYKGYNGIANVRIYGIEYTVWTYANVVRRYVRKDLKDRFPGKIVAREINSVDYTIPELNIPIEIQATIVAHIPHPHIKYASWENSIRKQIEQNIISSGRCLFYFDSDLLRAMQNANINISINMDWFRKYIKEGKLQVFTISHDGIVEPKEYKDFDFLTKISQTCPIAAEEDDLILNRNKMKIYANTVKGYDFTPEMVEKIEEDFEKYCHENYCRTNKEDNMDNFRTFLLKNNNEMTRLYGQVLHAIDDLPKINKILCREIDRHTYKEFRKHTAKILGIFDTYGKGSYVITRFIDKFDICRYFPGYLRNREIWEKLRRFNLNARQFENVVTGNTDVIRSFGSQTEIECAWSNGKNIYQPG